MPAAPEDVPAYLEDKFETGVRPSSLKVVIAAIARNRREAGFDAPVRHGVVRTVLDELTRDDASAPIKALPLDLDCYRAIRKTAHQTAWIRRRRKPLSQSKNAGPAPARTTQACCLWLQAPSLQPRK